MSRAGDRLPPAARRALWDRMWDRLLRPLPSEVVRPDDLGPSPEDEREARRDKAVPR